MSWRDLVWLSFDFAAIRVTAISNAKMPARFDFTKSAGASDMRYVSTPLVLVSKVFVKRPTAAILDLSSCWNVMRPCTCTTS